MNNIIKNLSKEIESYLSKRFIADNDVIDYAASTLGILSPDDLYDLVIDDFGESGILELIIYPDDGLRLNLEFSIPYEGISSHMEGMIIEYVTSSVKAVKISFDNHLKTVEVDFTAGMLNAFISKLFLKKRIDSKSYFNHKNNNVQDFNKAFVCLRKSQYFSTVKREEFLYYFIKEIVSNKKISEKDFLDCLNFIISLFNEVKDEIDIYSMIIQKKKFWKKILGSINSFEKTLGKYSMEFIMLQKISPPPFTEEYVKEKISTAELIELLIFEMDL